MKNIEVTYDALICENDNYEQGEAAFILPMTDELAASKKGRDEARAWATRTQDALHDFEAQEF